MVNWTHHLPSTLGKVAKVSGSPWAPRSLRELFQKYPRLDGDVAGLPEEEKRADV